MSRKCYICQKPMRKARTNSNLINAHAKCITKTNMRWTKAKVEQWCKEREITLSYSVSQGIHHVHLDIDSTEPMIFRGYGTHNASMWDSDMQSPNWSAIGNMLSGLDFGPCDDSDCEYCHEN